MFTELLTRFPPPADRDLDWIIGDLEELWAKTPGQIAYEEDVRRRPNYPDGGPRPPWSRLDELTQWSWERNPTPRFEPWPVEIAARICPVFRHISGRPVR